MDLTSRPCDGVVLMGHGSRDRAGVGELRSLAARLAAHPWLAGLPVEVGSLEFAGDGVSTIGEAFDRCIARGASRVAAVPLVFFAGGHGREDLPAEVVAARARYPELDIRQADVVGIDDGLLARLLERANAALAGRGSNPGEPVALLLVSSGSGSRAANADVFKAARLLADLAGGMIVEVAFLRLARPFLQDAVRRCEQLGARRVVVLPLFLNTGLLARRIPRKLIWLRRQFPGLDLVETPHLGLDPALVDALARRAWEALDLLPPTTSAATPVRLAAGRERSQPRWLGRQPGPPAAGAGVPLAAALDGVTLHAR
jgi:sirohydrochlorin cobaltochelatase